MVYLILNVLRLGTALFYERTGDDVYLSVEAVRGEEELI